MGDDQGHRDDLGSDQNHQQHEQDKGDDKEQQEQEEEQEEQEQEQEQEQEEEGEEQQRQQLQVLVTETVQQLERERLEEEEREERLLALRNLSPEDYLQQTGVSGAMGEALGVVAALRPANPLCLFSDISNANHARNTHPAVRQAKLLRYVVGPWARRNAAAAAAAAAAAGAVGAGVDGVGGDRYPGVNAGKNGGGGSKNVCVNNHKHPPPPRSAKHTTATTNAAVVVDHHRRFFSKLEVLCQPLHLFLCDTRNGNSNNGGVRSSDTRDRYSDAAIGSGTVVNRTGGAGGGGSATSKAGLGSGGRPRGTAKGTAGGGGGSGGGRSASGRGRGSAGGHGPGGGGLGNGGARARWCEVRRFLEALCRAAKVDDECTGAALAVLEREGRFCSSSSSPGSASAPAPAPSSHHAVMVAAAAPISGGGRGGFWRSPPPEVDVDFRRFTAAVRAILLFEGFYREARQAFVEVAGRVDGTVSLDKLLARLFPPDRSGTRSGVSSRGQNDEEGGDSATGWRGGAVRETIRSRLDVGRRGETKVRLSTLTDCVLSSSFHPL
ncbi:unnamed protein product [Ectocarpus sp. 4 AP-2014]